MKILFFIPSIINVSRDPLSYSKIRSIYTSEERLEQTIEGINSIRKFCPDSTIMLGEASDLNSEQEKKLKDKVEIFLPLYKQETVRSTRNILNKSLSELVQTSFMLNDPTVKNFDFIYKISGRYGLSEHYNQTYLTDKNKNKIILKKRFTDGHRHWFGTQLYCIGKNVVELMKYRIHQSIEIMKTNNFLDIESCLFSGMENVYLVEQEIMGCVGCIAINGEKSLH